MIYHDSILFTIHVLAKFVRIRTYCNTLSTDDVGVRQKRFKFSFHN